MVIILLLFHLLDIKIITILDSINPVLLDFGVLLIILQLWTTDGTNTINLFHGLQSIRLSVSVCTTKQIVSLLAQPGYETNSKPPTIYTKGVYNDFGSNRRLHHQRD